MSNLENIPLIDWFETTLAQAWDWLVGTMYVNDIPSFTFPSGVTTYVVVNPGKSTMQVAEINAKSSGQLTVSNVAIEKGAGVNYTSVLHSAGSKVIISDNYEFWKDIRTAVNSKLDQDGGNGTDYADTTARDAALGGDGVATKNYRMIKAGAEYYNYNLSLGQWQIVSTGTAPAFASETVAGVGEIPTAEQRGTGTSTGETGARLLVSNDALVKTSSGASDENKLPVLDATGKLALGFLPVSPAWQINVTFGETISAGNTVVPRSDGKVYNYNPTSLPAAHGITTTLWAYVWALNNSVHVFMWYDGANTLRLRVGAISSGVYTFGTTVIANPWSSNFSQLDTWNLIFIRWSDTQFSVVMRYLQWPSFSNYVVVSSQYTVSWTTITWNSDTTIFSSASGSNTLRWACLIGTNKIAITYTEETTERVVAGTLSGTTLTLGTPITVTTVWVPAQVATDIFLIAGTTDARRYTVSWTTITQWNSVSYGITLSTQNISTTTNSRCLITGTSSSNTVGCIIDGSAATPTILWFDTLVAGVAHTVSLASNTGIVSVVSGNTTMNTYACSDSYIRRLDSTPIQSVGGKNIFATSSWYLACISSTNAFAISIQKLFAIGVANQSGVNDDVKTVITQGGTYTTTGLVAWALYWPSLANVLVTNWDINVGVAVSATELRVKI